MVLGAKPPSLREARCCRTRVSEVSHELLPLWNTAKARKAEVAPEKAHYVGDAIELNTVGSIT